MKQHSSQEKYTIAWFKLAECVSRGEKERAFGVYRLLSHSIDNDAFACQLQGDLYFSFDDIAAAITKYYDAAHLYESEGRFLEAAAVYENLLTLKPHSELYRERIIALYHQLHIPTKILFHQIQLIEQFINEQKLKKAQEKLADLNESVAPLAVTAIHEKFIFSAIQEMDLPADQIEKQIRSLITIFVTHELLKEMRQFLSKLKALDEKWHDRAAHFLKD